MTLPRNISVYLWVCLLMQNASLYSHGFSVTTSLHTSEGWYHLDALTKLLRESKTIYNVDSSPVHGVATEVPITHIARGTSNCYIRFTVGPQYTDVLCCSPQQKFYVPAEKAWKEASELVVGDALLTKFGHRKQIHSIELIQQPTELYAIAVPEPHIFCIGNHGIVTHNMIIPGVMLSVSIPWGFETGVAMAAGFLGPVTWGLSLAVGGAAVLLYKCCSQKSKVHQYALNFDVAALAETVQYRSYSHSQSTYGSSRSATISGPCTCGHSCDSTCFCTCSCPCGSGKKVRNRNKRQQHERDQQGRKHNSMSKSEYFEKIKDRYEADHKGVWRLRRGAKPIEKAYSLEWDPLHDEVEAYSKAGEHLGAIDPKTNILYKLPVPGREI